MFDAIPPIDAWVSGSGTSEALDGPIPWNAPSSEARLLRRLQARRRGETGGRLWKSAEVDHRIPLFRVWNEHRDAPWPQLLDYWACQIQGGAR